MNEKIIKSSKVLIVVVLFVVTIHFLNTYGVNNLKDYIKANEEWAPFGFMILRATSIVIPALPSTAYSLLAGATLGFQKGVLVICLADLIACSISFSISRFYGKPIVKRLTGKRFYSKVEEFNKNNIENNFLLITGFLMTGLFDFVCYGVGLTKTKWIRFYPALILSILLSNPPIIALGAGILNGGKQILVFGALGIIVLSIISSKLKINYKNN